MSKDSKVAKLRSPIVVVLGHVDHGKCLHPDERVYLNDGRALKISELFPYRDSSINAFGSEGYEVVKSSTGLLTLTYDGKVVRGRAANAWRVKHRGYLYEIVLEDGSTIRVTPEHPFLTLDGWLKAEDIGEGEPLAVLLKTPSPRSLSKALREVKLTSLLKFYMNYLSNSRKSFWRSFFNALGASYGQGLGVNDYLEEFPSLAMSSGQTTFEKANLEYLTSLLVEAVKPLRGEYEGLPAYVLSAPNAYITDFLKGYYLVAGEIKPSPPRVVLRAKSINVAKDLKYLLTRFGIHSILINEGGKGSINVDGRDDLDKLFAILGISNPFSNLLPAEIMDETLVLKYKDLGFVKVFKVRKLSFKGYVYDFTIPPTNAFVAEGIIVHNTTLLDKIRGTAVVSKEPGEMTQHVGASIIPASVIEKLVKPLKKIFLVKLTIPGLLFIDTPGHEAFSNLRRRGGSIADFAILVIDVMEGIKQQTVESVEILMSRKVPFTIAANKIDRIYGWSAQPNKPFLESIKAQGRRVVEELDRKIYTMIGQLSRLGIPAERFDRIKDFRKAIAIVPVSAKTGEGIPELLAVLAGLTQKYLTKRIMFTSGPAKGVVLEVKEVTGLGACADIVVYDGVLRKGNTVVIGGINQPIVTKVRALLMPRPLEEMRVVGESEFMNVDEVVAAAGVRISAPRLDEALAGAPLYTVRNDLEIPEVIRKVSEEVTQVRFVRNIDGVVVKADTLGTLEALVTMLEGRGIPVRLADVGPLRKNEVIEASIVKNDNRYLGSILLFNVKPLSEAEELASKEGIKVFEDSIIYRLIEKYEKWVKEERSKELLHKLQETVFPAKIQVLPGYIFRRRDPAIVGVRVLSGTLRPGYPLMRDDGRPLGKVYQIQLKGKSISEAKKGSEVAISIVGNVLVGRHFSEGGILYTDPSEKDLEKVLTEFKDLVSDEDIALIKELIKVKQRKDRKFGLPVIFRLRALKKV